MKRGIVMQMKFRKNFNFYLIKNTHETVFRPGTATSLKKNKAKKLEVVLKLVL